MKVVSFEHKGASRFGVVAADEQSAVDVTDRFVSLRSVLERGLLSELEEFASARDADVDLAQVSFTSPVPDARRVICIGVNFKKVHPVHGVMPEPEHISMFSKFEGTLVGHGHDLHRPEISDTFDYEGEITLVIGQTSSRLTLENAAQAIAGITILNDGSVREYQAHSVTAGKNFEKASAIGPWMATLDEVGPLHDIHMTTFLNGTKVQDMRASEMLFSIEALLVYVTSFTTLHPGDIVSTGSPEREKVPGRASPYLQVGDTVDIEIDGVGRLSNSVVSRGW